MRFAPFLDWFRRQPPAPRENDRLDSGKEAVEWHRKERDEQENDEGIPPETEEIRQHCIWIVEAFPPSRIKALNAGLQSLGWNAQTPIDIDPVSWLDDARRGAWGGGWLNIGLILPEDSREQWFPRRKIASLPAGVRFANGALHQPIPSVSFAVFQFVLENDGHDRAVDAALRKRYRTVDRRLPGQAYMIVTPENQRQEAVRKVRQELHRRCERWIAERFPGFFANLNAGSGFPICEFISLVEEKPFERPVGNPIRSYLRTLRMDHAFDAWQSDALPGLRFGQTIDSRSDEPWTWILAGKWNQIFSDEDLKGYGGRTREGVTARVNDILRHSLVVIALWALLMEWNQQLSSLRDSVAAVDLHAKDGGIGALCQLQVEVVGQCRDLLPILDEVERLVENEKHFMYDVCEFTAIEERFRREPLFGSMRSTFKRHVALLRALESAVRESLTVSAAALQAISQERLSDANLNLQRSIKRLTAVAFALALLAFIVGLPNALPLWKAWFMWLWKAL